MRVLVVLSHYKPEEVAAAATYVEEIALDLTTMGHDVSALTAFPHYSVGKVFQSETYHGIFAITSKKSWFRILNFSSFSLTVLLSGLRGLRLCYLGWWGAISEGCS